jgi:RimJ/RimL family protein N-acetyltransferase
LRSVAEFAAHELGVEKILAGISESNPRSIRAFERAGFVRLPADTCRKVEAGGAIWRFTS